MNAKDYLMQVRILNNRIKNIDEEIQDIRSEIITVRSSWPTGQPHGVGTSKPVEEMVEKLVDELESLETQLLLLRSQLWAARVKIIDTIGKVEKPESNRLLYLRYVQLKRWEEIAVDMNYTYQWVCGTLHPNALYEVQQILDRN